MPLPPELMAPLGAVVAALLLFAGLLQFGVLIIRRLKLPQDLPEGPHYEPPPPPVADVLDPAAARTVAARQTARRAVYARAHDALRAAVACAEAALVPLPAALGADPVSARAELVRLAAVAKAAAEAAEQTMRSDGLDAATATERHAAEAEAAVASGVEVRKPFPPPGRLRLWLMLAALAVCILMILGLQVLR